MTKTWAGWGSTADDGELQSVNYAKRHANTVIRVSFYTTLGESHAASGCSEWFIFFNGRQCTKPHHIVTALFRRSKENAWYIIPSVLSGFCEETSSGVFPPGNLKISAHVRACERFPFNTSNAHTGKYHHGRRVGVTTSLVVEEYCKSP